MTSAFDRDLAATTLSFLIRGQFNIAIVGATGRLGKTITRVFSTTYKHQFSRILALTRDETSEAAQELAKLPGVEVQRVSLSESSFDANHISLVLDKIDVVVNALGAGASASEKDAVLEATVKAKARIYFPSEFGVDHRNNEKIFPSFDHVEWIKKRKHLELANELVNKNGNETRIIAIYCGLFLEMVFAGWSGLDVSTHTFTYLAPSSAPPFPRVAITSTQDVAHTIASLIPTFMVPMDLISSVPIHRRIAGNILSVPEIADIYKNVTGKEIELVRKDVSEVKEKLREVMLAEGEGWQGAPAGHIRILMGEGMLDFAADKDSRFMGPSDSLWTWKTVEGFIQEQYQI